MLEVVVAQSLEGQRSHPEVLDEDVAPGREPAHDRLPLGTLDVDGQAALAPVDEVERDRSAPRADDAAAHAVPRDRLDLDHLGAEVGEDRRAVRAGERAGDLQDADAGEEARLRRVTFAQWVRHNHPRFSKRISGP
ncbi:hypothetical protein LUX73_14080 [Actinomadura madurae]|nr:hypothetical protein [Actinomadura madurae]MCQ0005677.1 hypothetical protein [Actinomadura madurae]